MRNELLLIALLISLFLSIIILHKVRRMHIMAFRIETDLATASKEISRLGDIKIELANLYNQLQAYHDLVGLIGPTKPLPLLRGWAASPDFLLEICRHSLSHKPKIVLECSSGASTLALARCCELNGTGHVYSLEHDFVFAEQTRQRLRDQNLERWATVVDAPLVEQPEIGGQRWYSLTNLHIEPESCQLLIIDGPPSDTSHQARYPALPLLSRFLSRPCTVFLDDAQRPDEQQAVKRWLNDFPAFTLEQLQCEKGCSKLTRKGSN